MSSYYRLTKNPESGEWEAAFWIDDHFGPRKYGVRFPSGLTIDPEVIELETKTPEVVDSVVNNQEIPNGTCACCGQPLRYVQ